MTTFRRYQDVAAVEHDEAGKPLEGGEVTPCTVIKVNDWPVVARRADGAVRLFLLDSRGRAWAGMGQWRLVPVCRCESPILGEPVTDPDDLTGRVFCSRDCLTAAAEASYEQRYQPGVAT